MGTNKRTNNRSSVGEKSQLGNTGHVVPTYVRSVALSRLTQQQATPQVMKYEEQLHSTVNNVEEYRAGVGWLHQEIPHLIKCSAAEIYRRHRHGYSGTARQVGSFNSCGFTAAEHDAEVVEAILQKYTLQVVFNNLGIDQVVGGDVECSKCGSNKVTVKAEQSRSLDEGMTIYCKCQNCSTSWKMS